MKAPALLMALALSVAPAAAQDPVVYEVSFPNAVHHEAEISVTFPGLPAGRPLEARMSRSSPGRYALHEFAKNVYNIRAFDGQGRPLTVTRPDPHRWNVAGHDGTVRITYTLFGDWGDGTYAQIDNTHAHLNAPATFLWARGLSDRPVRVTFRRPRPEWKIATQLVPTGNPEVFTAPNFQYLMDSPVELSAHDLRSWQVSSSGKTYTIRLAVHHAGTPAQLDTFADMARRVVAEEIAAMGEAPDFDYGTYTFLADYLPQVAGDGMEHRNSTVVTSTRPLATPVGRLGNLGTISHEFFHAWNVERIRPRSLEPFDFEEANLSGELWFAEGFTQYYTPLFIRRAGITGIDQYARSLSGTINEVVLSPGRQLFSAVEMSMQAPFVDAAVSIDRNNRGNTFVSYYTWGAGIGLGLELALRSRSPALTLDDYMRAVWRDFGRAQDPATRSPQRPYTVADLRNTLATLTGDRAFAEDFFRRYVEGHEAPDYGRLLAPAGLLLRRAQPGRPWIGETVIRFDTAGAIVAAYPLAGSPLYRAGLTRGDRILSVDGRPVSTTAELEAVLGARRPGDTVLIGFEQRGERRTASLAVAESPVLEVVTYEAAGRPVTAAMRAFRESWLGSRAGPAR
ncbi:MAG TPA: PDZ domain-containing protein [Longimicrobiaceae bacterium]|nr:PDZ domain-containing protein [Longimicrobiaceae bacterium]